MDSNQYMEEGLKIIKTLVRDGALQQAFNACGELLKINPYHRGIQKYLQKINGIIMKKNEEKVNADLDSTMHLFKEGRLEELLEIYARLYQFAPQSKRLIKLIEKANGLLSAQQKDARQNFVSEALRAIKGLMQEQKFGDTVQACSELLTVDPLNEDAKKYLKKAKTAIIEKKLDENERIIDSTEFERALELYNSLLAIDAENSEVKRLILQAKENLSERQYLAAKIHLNESIKRMKKLFAAAEYEKVLQACEEIDRLEPGNFTARVFKKKAINTLHAEIEHEVVKKMQANIHTLEPEYLKNPMGFVKL